METLIDLSSPYNLLYKLNIIECLVYPTEEGLSEERRMWSERFAVEEGF